MRTFVFVLTVSLICAACEKPKTAKKAMSPARGAVVKAYFNSRFKSQGNLNGFWSVDAVEYAVYMQKKHTDSSSRGSDGQGGDSLNGRYFLRIEGKSCDELIFGDDGEFTISGGNLGKLETAKDRVAYSVTFNRELPNGVRFSQGAILSAFRNEKRIILEFPDYKLTFRPAAEDPAALVRQLANHR